MGFDENQFINLMTDMQKAITEFGFTTSKSTLKGQKRLANQVIKHLKELNIPFERESCLQWVDSLEHEPSTPQNSSYKDWIALRRFVILLAEQDDGILEHWRRYKSKKIVMPVSENFIKILEVYKEFMFSGELSERTVEIYSSDVRRFLLYLESQGLSKVCEMQNEDVANYFLSQRFTNRKPMGIKAETGSLRNFLSFLSENGYNDCKILKHALPYYRVPVQRIVTTLTPEMVSDTLKDKADSLVNLRDKAVCLLALHIGLRSSDICNLKFDDIDFDKEILTIRQKKTNVELQMPMDSGTQNAIIDYVLHERRNSKTKYIFIRSKGPAQKLGRIQFRNTGCDPNTSSYGSIPERGLHIMRRTYASNLLKSGTPLPMISKMLGQIDKKAVQHYVSTDDNKMRRCALDMSHIPYKREEF